MTIGTQNYTAFIGLKNTILIATENANLVLQKEYSQDVKDLYNALELEKSNLLD